jgi:hemerythrin-like domain-containing protein
MPAATILSRMRADHRRVTRDLDTVEAAIPSLRSERSPSPRGRRPSRADWSPLRFMLARLARQFETHMVAEEESLFPALERALPETAASLAPLRAEHAELRALLASLTALIGSRSSGARDEQVVVQWKDFAALLRIHVRKEEAVVFSVAEKVLPPRELARVEALRFPPRTAARARSHSSHGKDVHP